MGLAAVAAASGQYSVLVDFDDIRIGNQYNILGGAAFLDGQVFAIARGIESDITPAWESQIVRVDDPFGLPQASLLVPDADWKTLVAGDDFTTILAGNRMALISDQLQFVDQASDGVYRVDPVLGGATPLVTADDMDAHTGAGPGNLIDAVGISPWGEMAIYDQASDSVLLVAADGELTTFISASDFAADLPGNPINYVAGGMTFDDRGVFYWTLSQTGGTGEAGGKIYRRDCDGTITVLMEALNIWDITLTFGNVAFNDLFFAPDGNLYFYDRDSDGILNFDPYDPRLPVPPDQFMPEDLLFSFLTESELESGPGGTDFVAAFSASEDQLLWNMIVSQSPDLYAAPLAGSLLQDADFDRSRTVDQVDFMLFEDDAALAMGPGVAYDPDLSALPADCRGFLPTDIDVDGDIDLVDFATLAVEYGFGT
jgi:hypothetical protein